MRRATVLHVLEQWGRPSERFVTDLVRSTTATRAVVASFAPDGRAVPSWPGRRYRLAAPLPAHALLAGVALRERARVAHAHFALSANCTWRAARRLAVPTAVSVHGWDVLVAARKDPGIVAALCAADLVVTPSRFLAERVLALGVPAEVLRVVPSGVDLADLPWRLRTVPRDPPLVTFAGRFVPKKGVLDAARALIALARARPLRARFVGYGPEEAPLRALLAGSGLSHDIVDGRLPGAVRRAIAASDVVVTASRTGDDGDAETLCLVNLEAQACGAPLVTTDNGGIPEALDPAAALVVPDQGNIAAALAAALGELLDEPGRWPAMGTAGRRFVSTRFELGARTADMEELWRALAAGVRGNDLPRPLPASLQRPTISVVLVTHDRRHLLERTLDALAAQTVAPDEVIVVDNGSTDGTAALLAERSRLSRPAGLRVLTRPANLPVAEGRNLAVAVSSGEVVAFTDDDCRPRSTWLEALLAGFAPAVGIVQGRTGADPTQPLQPLSRTQWTPAEYGLYETCNIAYRRAALLGAGPAPPGGPFSLEFATAVAHTLGPRWRRYPFGEDTELAWRVKRTGVASRFAAHAVVDHEVFSPDAHLLLRRAALAAAFPALVSRVPELRDIFLWHRVVLGPHRARGWLAAAGLLAAAALRRGWPVAFAAPYAADVLGVRQWRRPGRRAWLAAAPVLVRRDLAESLALLRGSWRARTLVL